MTEDHDLIIRLDEKVEAAQKAIDELKSNSATDKDLKEVKGEVKSIKLTWWGLGLVLLKEGFDWMSKGNS